MNMKAKNSLCEEWGFKLRMGDKLMEKKMPNKSNFVLFSLMCVIMMIGRGYVDIQSGTFPDNEDDV